MKAIESYHLQQTQSECKSTDERLNQLKANLEELTNMARSINPNEALTQVINGQNPLDIVASIQSMDLYTDAIMLVEQAINTLQHEQEERYKRLGEKMQLINTAYAGLLRLKTNILERKAQGLQVTGPYKIQYEAIMGSLINALRGTPDNLVQELIAKINKVEVIPTLSEMVG